jgi:hypothetical protein
VATGSWHSRTRPTWRMLLVSSLGRLRNVKNVVPVGLPLAGVFVLFLAASMLGRTLPMAVAAAGLALILQGIATPTPLFWTVPWEALEFVLSRQVRANHLWLHRTEVLLRASGSHLAKVDGVATRDGFFLIGTSLSETEIQWASEYVWRARCQKSSAKVAAPGCKTTQFLLALSLIAGGLPVLSLWRPVDLAGAFLLAAVGGAAGHFLTGPTEKLMSRWAENLACSDNKKGPFHFQVDSLAVPRFWWPPKGRVFHVRRISLRESNEG